MDAIWTGMIVFYCLLFTVALLLFTCLCILCKRKQRKTRDLREAQATAGERTSRPRPSLAHLCADVVSSASGDTADEQRTNTGTTVVPSAGRLNLVFESDNISLPPEYDEALKSKYAKVYSIYPSLGSLRRGSEPMSSPSPPLSSPSASSPPSTSSVNSPTTSFVTGESHLERLESPPPPYEQAVRYIDSRGHL